MKKLTLILAASLFAAQAQAATVDFESTPSGILAEGTVIGGITFTSALGSGLEVGNFGVQSQGQGLLVRTDANSNFLKGAIAGGANFIELAFGNDDPFFTVAGDLATLKLFSGATLLDTITVALNRDDILNQTISYTGTFDNFTFAYTSAAGGLLTGGPGTNTGLIEVVDNITYTTGAVPEPASWAMMIAGFGLAGGALRRRNAQRLALS